MFEKGREGRSQSNEDELLKRLFRAMGLHAGVFCEFGCGDGRQNNTIALLKLGWSGTWLDVHKRRVESARERWPADKWPLTIIRRLVTPDNVNKLINDDLDLLSIDVDGYDAEIWKAVIARPRVVIIEVDAINGTSFGDMVDIALKKGYAFKDISSNQVNAIFVREDRL